MNRDAYGVTTDREVKGVRKSKKTIAFDGEIDPYKHVTNFKSPDYMPRSGRAFTVETTHLKTTCLKWPEVGMKIKNQYGLKPQEMKAIGDVFKQRFPEGIPEDQLKDYVQEVVNDCKASIKAG